MTPTAVGGWHRALPAAWAPWTDKKGRLHPLRAVVFALLLLPGLWIGLRLELNMLGPRALNTAIHATGYWACWFLIISLMVSPAKAFLGMPNLIVVRRMIGNAALAYAAIHLTLYSADQNWRMWTVVREIVLRFYLTIGFVTLLGLAVLGATSTDGAIRRLGARWKQLHRIVYGLGALAIIHYLLQTKADISLPLLAAGVFFWLMLWRVLPLGRDRGPAAIIGLTVAAAALTGLAEWGWYRFGTHIDPIKVLRSEEDVTFGLHPIGQVLALGLLVLAAVWLRRLSQRGAAARPGFWVAVFALGAGTNELAVFMFGIDRYLEPGDLIWLWQDLAWAALLGVLGLVRWRCGTSPKRHIVDGLGVACIAFQIMLSSNGLRGAGIALAASIIALWATLAWQTWRETKLAALTLVPLGLVLAYGISSLM
jgi:sulfoxide reductase heme-binding subunit YedZ